MLSNAIVHSKLASNSPESLSMPPEAVQAPSIAPPRLAGPVLLCGFAVSAVISGQFAGWNPGLSEGGFGGMLVATLLITLMYGCLTLTLAELCAAMPFTGGAYAYSRAVFGRWGGLLAGVSQILEYVAALATILVAIGIQVNIAIFSASATRLPEPLVWLLVALFFAALNAGGKRLFFRTALCLAASSLAVLAIFWTSAIPNMRWVRLLSIPTTDTNSAWLPNGLMGIAWAMPFAIWFYLAIEAVSLAPEDSRVPGKDVPKGLIWGFCILVVATLATLTINTGGPPGAAAIAVSESPLLLGMQSTRSLAKHPELLNLIVMFGTLASYHAVLYAAARSFFCIARSGYMPKALAGLSMRGTPLIAILVSTLLALALVTVSLILPDKVSVIAILLNVSVFGALVSYAMIFLAFIILRARHKDMPRPFISPVGVAGAMTGLLVTLVTTVLMFTNETFHYALFLCVIFYLLSLVIYLIFRRTHVDPNAPEEAFASLLSKEFEKVADAPARGRRARRPRGRRP